MEKVSKWNNTRVCEVCEKEYMPKSKNQKICSEQCRDYKQYSMRKSFKGEDLETFIQNNMEECEKCGQSFYRKELRKFWWGRPSDSFCKNCWEEELRKKKQEEERIRKEVAEERERERLKNLKQCPECGTYFSHPSFKHCSTNCWLAEKNRKTEHEISIETFYAVIDMIDESKQKGYDVKKVLISGESISLVCSKEGE